MDFGTARDCRVSSRALVERLSDTLVSMFGSPMGSRTLLAASLWLWACSSPSLPSKDAAPDFEIPIIPVGKDAAADVGPLCQETKLARMRRRMSDRSARRQSRFRTIRACRKSLSTGSRHNHCRLGVGCTRTRRPPVCAFSKAVMATTKPSFHASRAAR